MSLQRVWIPSPNYSSRGGSRVRLVVLHTAEGSTTIESLGSYFANPASQVSSHVGIDDKPNTVGEFVHRSDKAWTAEDANPYAVQAELCAFAAWGPGDWAAHPTMLANTAAWVAEECAAFGIPLVRLNAAQAQDGHSAGVTDHYCLGEDGGGHWDCGPAFEAPGGPFDQILAMAAGGATGPAPKKGTHMWTLDDPESDGEWVCDENGNVYAYDGAPYLGGAGVYNDGGWPCSGLADYHDGHGAGYLITLDAGDGGPGDRFLRYRFPRDGSAAKR